MLKKDPGKGKLHETPCMLSREELQEQAMVQASPQQDYH